MAGRNLPILVADDQKPMRDIFARVLRSLGYDCDIAVDGRDCLHKLMEKEYAVLFLDLVMPEIDGETVVGWVRAHHPETIVIVSSVLDDEASIRALLRVGATAYLMKPFTAQDLASIMHGIENRRTAAGLTRISELV